MNLKTYVASYWRNDGGWHSEFEYAPSYTFCARNDSTAQEVARDFYWKNKSGWADFSLISLIEIELRTKNISQGKTGLTLLRREIKISFDKERDELETMILEHRIKARDQRERRIAAAKFTEFQYKSLIERYLVYNK